MNRTNHVTTNVVHQTNCVHQIKIKRGQISQHVTISLPSVASPLATFMIVLSLIFSESSSARILSSSSESPSLSCSGTIQVDTPSPDRMLQPDLQRKSCTIALRTTFITPPQMPPKRPLSHVDLEPQSSERHLVRKPRISTVNADQHINSRLERLARMTPEESIQDHAALMMIVVHELIRAFGENIRGHVTSGGSAFWAVEELLNSCKDANFMETALPLALILSHHNIFALPADGEALKERQSRTLTVKLLGTAMGIGGTILRDKVTKRINYIRNSEYYATQILQDMTINNGLHEPHFPPEEMSQVYQKYINREKKRK
eukprot:TRINITY_DN4014_c0_g1_i4.p1 TRINITY_DN4014_c0_g1~~TRINITY_DN4014_c0_g1_i4.p1  ORF type:complete len:318 (-),score=39.73 TRINITY_DN4014_c0_g1_i4:102-1055(-)